ncbi:helix-turn-helix domain-containing protein [Paenibacillus brasilensis]|uniref:DNA-binding Xre family transcriptional regulator n=1 Tax=Paenibacillus brasilensis TaxID=128574 RepID=A0ABU0KVK3_9BACL|nr:helix-turn-helix domain-containing protein [Paenibacillus brasilensis]MDQ0493471.1 DNA-binding Xre family transcriptional regulator [Paenibacillus brasilensis]
MAINIKLEETLGKAGITKNALARKAKVRSNLIYDMCDGKTKRIDLSDVLEYIPRNEKNDHSPV